MADELLATSDQVLASWSQFGNLPAVEQTALIAAASQAVINFCRRPGFLAAFTTETLDGKNYSRLWLSRRPIIQVISVTINGLTLDNTDGNAWSFKPGSGAIFRGPNATEPRFSAWFPAGNQNVVVQYWGGYPELPDPVVRATVIMTRYLWEFTRMRGLYQGESIGDYSYTLNALPYLMQTMPVIVGSLLAFYVQDDGPQ